MPKNTKRKPPKRKPGRPADRLIITGDPKAALDRLLKRPPKKSQ